MEKSGSQEIHVGGSDLSNFPPSKFEITWIAQLLHNELYDVSIISVTNFWAKQSVKSFPLFSKRQRNIQKKAVNVIPFSCKSTLDFR